MYPLSIALKSLLREKWINLLTALTIGFALLIMSMTFVALYNLEMISKKLPEKFTIMAYLKDGISESDIYKVRSSLEAERLVKSVTYFSKEEAFRDLKKNLRGSEFILEGLDENPLSPSFEIKIRKEMFSPDAVQSLIASIRQMPSVDDVDYGKGFLDFVQSFRKAMRAVGIFFAVLISFAIVFVIYSTVKILFYRRKDEIETYKLLGATAGFIRAPFLIEGCVIGFSGGVLGIMEALLFYYALFFRLGSNIPLLRYISFPLEMFGLLPVAGMFLGLFGTMVALGRIRF